jgi:hypothetical protein
VYVAPAGGDGIRRLSISPWQFAPTRTHFLASSLGYENPLDLLETARDGLSDAALASPASAALPAL